jgi:tetrahydromethanopterin S-methyltransferase subunit D
VLYTGEWRLQYEQETPGPKGRLLPPVICGAVSGLVPGLLVGGIGGALFFALLAACTAAVLTRLEQRTR